MSKSINCGDGKKTSPVSNTKNISFYASRSYSFNVSPNSRYEVEVGVEPAAPCQREIQSQWAVPVNGTCITPASGKWFLKTMLSNLAFDKFKKTKVSNTFINSSSQKYKPPSGRPAVRERMRHRHSYCACIFWMCINSFD